MPEVGTGAPMIRFMFGPNLSVIFGEYLQLLSLAIGRGPVLTLLNQGHSLDPPPQPPRAGQSTVTSPPGSSSTLRLPVRRLVDPPGLGLPQPLPQERRPADQSESTPPQQPGQPRSDVRAGQGSLPTPQLQGRNRTVHTGQAMRASTSQQGPSAATTPQVGPSSSQLGQPLLRPARLQVGPTMNQPGTSGVNQQPKPSTSTQPEAMANQIKTTITATQPTPPPGIDSAYIERIVQRAVQNKLEEERATKRGHPGTPVDDEEVKRSKSGLVVSLFTVP